MNKDDLIIKALLDAEQSLSDESLVNLDVEHEFSDEFESSMQKLISKNDRIKLYTRRRISRGLIAAVIAAVVMFTGLLSVSASKYNPLDFITNSQKKHHNEKTDNESFLHDFPSITIPKHNANNTTTNIQKKQGAKQFTISVKTGENGTTSASSVKVKYGKNAPSIVIMGNHNYAIDTLTIDGKEIKEAKGRKKYDVSEQLKNVKANHSVYATFALNRINVSFNITGAGMVDIKDGDSVLNAGLVKIINDSDETPLTETKQLLTGQTIQAIVKENKYHIESFKVGSDELIEYYDNDTHESPVYSFKKDGTSISVVYALDTYSVVANSSGNGTVILDKNEVEYGDSATVNFIPNEDYDVSSFKINGEDMLDSIDDYTYVIDNITGDITISAEFSSVLSQDDLPDDLDEYDFEE